MHRLELALEDAAEDLELQLEIAQVLVRVVEDVVLLNDRIVVLEADLIGETTLEFGAGEEDEVLVALDERRRLDDLVLDLEQLCLLGHHAAEELGVAPLTNGARAAEADAMALGDDLGELVEPPKALLGGGDLAARPCLRPGDAELAADLIDGNRAAAPPILVGVTDGVALRLVLLHREGVRED